MDRLVEKLSDKSSKVIIGYRNESYDEIEERIKNGYFHIKFTETQGETELGINIDLDKINLREISFEQGTGTLHIEGTTNLNFVPVRCVADIELSTRQGMGFLRVEQA